MSIAALVSILTILAVAHAFYAGANVALYALRASSVLFARCLGKPFEAVSLGVGQVFA
jgi:isopropylmalate/homocitrate/citramalate synthase